MSPTPRSAFSLRALVIGIVGTLLISLGAPYVTNVVKGSAIAYDFTTPGAVFVLLVLSGGLNVILGLLCPRWRLAPWELLVVYTMMLIASAIADMGLASQLPAILAAPAYYASVENRWKEVLLPHIKPELLPHGEKVIRYFFEKMPKGMTIPWGAWLKPLFYWALLLLPLYFMMIALMVILRKQWSENEKLVYPLTTLPMEMVREDRHSVLPPFFRNPVMWIGFGISFLVGCLVALHNYYPAFPEIKYASALPWFRGKMSLAFRLSFPMLGFFYLVNLETAFSIWFFNLLSQVFRGLVKINAFGMGALQITEDMGIYGSPDPLFKQLGMGAMIALVFGGLWKAREHLRRVFRKAFFNDPTVDDSGEIMSYRFALFGTIISGVMIALWLCWSGMPLVPMLVFLVATMVIFIGLTRIVSESGLSEAVASTTGSSFAVAGLGTRAFTDAGLGAVGLTYIWCADIRTFVMASAATGLKLAELTPPRRRNLFWFMALAVVLSAFSSIALTIALSYIHGGLKLSGWFFQGGPLACWNYIADKIKNPHGPIIAGWSATAVGAAIMWSLQLVRQRFLWFPFHPLGFCVGTVWIMDQLWLTCLLAWLLKGAILRYGGFGAYHRMRPFFLGLIAGQFSVNGFWILIDIATGKQGNFIFWI